MDVLTALREQTVLGQYLLLLGAQAGLYLVAASGFSAFFKICQRFEIGEPILARARRPEQKRAEISWSLLACTVIAVCLVLTVNLSSRLVADSLVEGLGYVVLVLVVYDLYMYATHRLLHMSVFIRFHSRHHTAVAAAPWSCLNVHPVEAGINYLPFPVMGALFDVPLAILLGVHAYLIVGIANGHSNYNLLASRKKGLLFELNTFHQKHHSDGRGNFGLLLTNWDWLFGTRHAD